MEHRNYSDTPKKGGSARVQAYGQQVSACLFLWPATALALFPLSGALLSYKELYRQFTDAEALQ